MLFTYQKKTGKLITSRTTHLPSIQQNDYVQIDVNYNNANNNNANNNMFSTNLFSRAVKTTKCDSCDH